MEVKGIDSTINKLKKISDKIAEQVAMETREAAMEIEAMAVDNAPHNLGTLRQSIRASEVNDYFWQIAANSNGIAPYAAYIEFGTGGKVSVPKEMQAIANSFKGKKSGSFEEGLSAIKGWCKDKGIPEQAAYPIFLKILRFGQEPHPYMYPALVQGRKDYIKRLKQMLKKYGPVK